MELGARLVGSKWPSNFNRHRSKDNFDSAFGLVLSERDLRGFNLRKFRFTRVKFTNVSFGFLEQVEFNECVFENCVFSRPDESGGEAGGAVPLTLHRVLFYECRFVNGDFRYCYISDLKIAKCSFSHQPRFTGARARGILHIKGSGGVSTFAFLHEIEAIEGWNCIFNVDFEEVARARLDWSAIRLLQQLPILQTSMFGFVILSCEALLFTAVAGLLAAPIAACRKLASLDPNDGVSKVCQHLGMERLSSAIAAALATSLLIFALLLSGSVIHKLGCPDQIVRYSFTQWIETGRPRISYFLQARRRLFLFFVCVLLYAAGSALLIISLFRKILIILSAI